MESVMGGGGNVLTVGDRPALNAAAPPVPSGIVKFQAPEIVFGPGALAEAGFAARRLGAQRPFVVTDPGIIEAG